jgi:AcrR family transcriptional regulator
MATSGQRRGVGTAPPARVANTRAALIKGAIEALREVGYAGASAREIARRAGCNQALVFYHFGSVLDLLLAALDDISERRGRDYAALVDDADGIADLITSARRMFNEDLDAGHLTVLVEMITAAQATPGLGEQVAARLAPWRTFAETAVQRAIADSPLALLVPARELAHAVVAGFLGLELLASLDGDRASALALFDRAQLAAGLLDMAGGFSAQVNEGGTP